MCKELDGRAFNDLIAVKVSTGKISFVVGASTAAPCDIDNENQSRAKATAKAWGEAPVSLFGTLRLDTKFETLIFATMDFMKVGGKTKLSNMS